jgi:rhodanese-related sulfurtransferase
MTRKTVSGLLAAVLMTALPLAMAADKVSPETVKGAATVDGTKAKALFDKGVVFVDVRSDKDWQAGHIPGAVHLDLNKGYSDASLGAKVKKGQDVVMYCNGPSCLRSSEAAEKAVGWGYGKVHYYRLGFPDWKAAGYPVE